jgi:hypothetical protein
MQFMLFLFNERKRIEESEESVLIVLLDISKELPTYAVIQTYEFSSFSCSFCGDFCTGVLNWQLARFLIRQGQVPGFRRGTIATVEAAYQQHICDLIRLRLFTLIPLG